MSDRNGDDLTDLLWSAYYPGDVADLTWSRWVAEAKPAETDELSSDQQKIAKARYTILSSWYCCCDD